MMIGNTMYRPPQGGSMGSPGAFRLNAGVAPQGSSMSAPGAFRLNSGAVPQGGPSVPFGMPSGFAMTPGAMPPPAPPVPPPGQYGMPGQFGLNPGAMSPGMQGRAPSFGGLMGYGSPFQFKGRMPMMPMGFGGAPRMPFNVPGMRFGGGLPAGYLRYRQAMMPFGYGSY